MRARVYVRACLCVRARSCTQTARRCNTNRYYNRAYARQFWLACAAHVEKLGLCNDYRQLTAPGHVQSTRRHIELQRIAQLHMYMSVRVSARARVGTRVRMCVRQPASMHEFCKHIGLQHTGSMIATCFPNSVYLEGSYTAS